MIKRIFTRNRQKKFIFRAIINRIFNWKFLLTVLSTACFALLLRYFYVQYLGLTLDLSKLDLNNLSFCAFVSFFRAVFSLVLDQGFMYDSATPNGPFKDIPKPKHFLLMENENTEKSQASGSNTEERDAKPSELIRIAETQTKTMKDMHTTLREIRDFKKSHDVRTFESKEGDLHIDLPVTVSDEKAREITEKIYSLDTQFNELNDTYKTLLKDAKKANYVWITDSYKSFYKDLLGLRNNIYSNKE